MPGRWVDKAVKAEQMPFKYVRWLCTLILFSFPNNLEYGYGHPHFRDEEYQGLETGSDLWAKSQQTLGSEFESQSMSSESALFYYVTVPPRSPGRKSPWCPEVHKQQVKQSKASTRGKWAIPWLRTIKEIQLVKDRQIPSPLFCYESSSNTQKSWKNWTVNTHFLTI